MAPTVSIEPDDTSVDWMDDQSFDIEADSGYVIESLTVDGAAVAAAAGQTTYTYGFTNVTDDHTISATFAQDTYTIDASAEGSGSIDPSGSVSVDWGEGQSFTITAESGNHILELTVDGSEVSEAAGQTTYTYEFTNVSDDHTISVTFEADI